MVRTRYGIMRTLGLTIPFACSLVYLQVVLVKFYSLHSFILYTKDNFSE